MNKRTCIQSFQSLLCVIIVFTAVFPVRALAEPGEVPSSGVATENALGSERSVTAVFPGSASSAALSLAPSPQHEGDDGEVLSIVVAPQDVMAGQQATFTVKIRNTGTTTWDPNDVAAEVVVLDEEGNPLATGHGADAMPFEAVAPGAEASVSVYLQVPVDWTGTYQYTTKVWVQSTLLEAHTEANSSLEVSPMMGPIDIRQGSAAMWAEGVSAAGESGGGQAVDLVFAMDTSGSMYDEFSALCGKIDDIIADLQGRGITVRYRILGITGSRECATDTVSNLVSGATSNHVEDWGPATYDLSNGYDWVPGYVRLIIPMSDEGPEGGDPCNDPGDDRDAITSAIDAARTAGVAVSPVLGTGYDACSEGLAQDLADGTGGRVFYSTQSAEDLAAGLMDLISSLGAPLRLGNFYIDDAISPAIVNKAAGDPVALVAMIRNTDNITYTGQVTVEMSSEMPASWTSDLQIRIRKSPIAYEPDEVSHTLEGSHTVVIDYSMPARSSKYLELTLTIPASAQPGLIWVSAEYTAQGEESTFFYSQTRKFKVVESARAIIVTNRKLLYDKYREEEVTALLDYLSQVGSGAPKGSVPAVIYYLDWHEPSADNPFANWDNQSVDYTSSQTANRVADLVASEIATWTRALNADYLLLVGGDEIVPFHRIVAWGEDDHLDLSGTPEGEAIAHNYSFTDMGYSSRELDATWDDLFDIAVGRIVGAGVAEMRAFVKNSLAGPTDLPRSILASVTKPHFWPWDAECFEVDDVVEALDRCNLYPTHDFVESHDWTKEDLFSGLNEGPMIVALAGHSNYSRYALPNDERLWTSDIVDLSQQVEAAHPFVHYSGCRAGMLGNPDTEMSSTDNNVWAWIGKGASGVLASAALTQFNPTNSMFLATAAERWYNSYYVALIPPPQDLPRHQPVGDAYIDTSEDFDQGNTQAAMQFILYGVPWMELWDREDPCSPPASGSHTSGYRTEITSPSQSAQLQLRPDGHLAQDVSHSRNITFEVTNYQITQTESYDFVVITDAIQLVEPLKPVVPQLSGPEIYLPPSSTVRITVTDRHTQSLGSLNIANYRPSVTLDPQYPYTTTTTVTGKYPSPNYEFRVVDADDHAKVTVYGYPVQYDPNTHETILWDTLELELSYEAPSPLVVTAFGAVPDSIQVGQPITTVARVENISSEDLTDLTAYLTLTDTVGNGYSSMATAPFSVTSGASRVITPTFSQVISPGHYMAELTVQNSSGISLARSTENVEIYSGRILTLTTVSEVAQAPGGAVVPFEISFLNAQPYPVQARATLDVFSTSAELTVHLVSGIVDVPAGSVVAIPLDWNTVNLPLGAFIASAVVEADGQTYGPASEVIQLYGVRINDGEAWTRDPTITLEMRAPAGITQTMISNAEAGPWYTRSLTDSVAWDIADPIYGGTGNDGIKSVYARFLMPTAQWSAVYSDSIIYDTTPPTAAVEDLPAYTHEKSFPVRVSGDDAEPGSGIAYYDVQFRVGDSLPWTTWLSHTFSIEATFGPSLPVSVTDLVTYSFRARGYDAASNVGDYAGQDPDACTVISLVDVNVGQSTTSSFVQGQQVQYRVTYENQGSGPALSPVLTSTLVDELSYHSDTSGLSPTVAGNQVVWNLGVLDAGQTGWFDLIATVAPDATVGALVTQTLEIAAQSAEANKTDNLSALGRAVIAPTRDLAVSKVLQSGIPVRGNEIEYRIQYENQGNTEAADVVITDTLPLSTTYVSDQNSYGFTTLITGSTVVWTRDTVAANSSGYLYLTVRIDDDVVAGATLANKVSVATSDEETDYSDNVFAHTLTAAAPTRDLYISKGLYTGLAAPGNTVTYLIYYNNEGNSPAENVVLTDTLPAEMTYDPSYSGSDTSGWTRVASGNQVTWTRPSLDASQSGYLYVSGHITDTTPARVVLTNTVQAATSHEETDYSDNEYRYPLTVLSPGCDLGISKSWTDGKRVAGQSLTYRIDYQNLGALQANDVIITDTLPSGMAYGSSSYFDYSWTMAQSGNVITWARSYLPYNSSGSIQLTVAISDTVDDGTVLTNTVEIASGEADDEPTDNRDEHPLTISTADRDLYVAKWLDSGTAVPGGEMTYRLHYRNYGTDLANSVTLTDTLPVEASYLSHSGAFSPTVNGNVLTWDLGTVPGQPNTGYEGYLYVTVRLSDTAPVGTDVCNQVEISTPDPETGLMENHGRSCHTIQMPTRDLYVSKFLNSDPGAPGGEMEYRIYFSNQGNSTASDVVLTDTLPLSTTYVSWYGYANNPDYGSLGSAVTPTVESGQVVWDLGSMVAGGYGYLYLTVGVTDTASAGEMLTNVVEVSTSDLDIDSSNDAYTHTTTVAPFTRDMYVSKNLSSDPGAPGDEMEYRIYFRNQGNSTASNVILTDTLPLSTTYVSWHGYANNPDYVSLGSAVTSTVENGQVVWDLGPLVADGYGYLYLTVGVTDTTNAGEVLTNVVQVSTGDLDIDPGNDVYTQTTSVAVPTQDMYVAKAAAGVSAPGTEMYYSIYFENRGNSTASEVVLTDTLPLSITYVSWSGYVYNPEWIDLDQVISPTVEGGQVVWDLGSLVADGYGSIYLTGRVTDTASVGEVLTNVVEVSTGEADIDPSNDVYTLTTPVVSLTRDMEVSKWLVSDPGAPGGSMEYQIDFTNRGNTTVSNLFLTDTLPLSTTYDFSWGGVYRQEWMDYVYLHPVTTTLVENGQVVWDLGPVGPHDEGHIHLTMFVSDTADVGQVLTNVVRVSSSDLEIDPSDDAYTHTTTVAPLVPDVYVTKWLNGSAGAPGGEMQYWISFGNTGTSTAPDVILTDTLPLSTTHLSWSGFAFNPGPVDLDQVVTPTVEGGQVVWDLGPLVTYGFGDIYLTVLISDTASIGDVLTNIVEISTSDLDLDPSNDVYTQTTTVIGPSRDMHVAKWLNSGPGLPGEEMQYQINFANAGNMTAADVVLTDTLPLSTTYVSWSGYTYDPDYSSLDGIITPTVEGGQVVWDLGPLGANGSGDISLTLLISDKASVGDMLANVVEVSTSDLDVDPSNDVYTHTTTIVPPTLDLDVTKELITDPGAPGGTMQYRIYFSNQGNSTSSTVVLTDTLPSSVTYLSSWGDVYDPYYTYHHSVMPPTVEVGQVVWDAGSVTPYGFGEIYLTVGISDTASAGDVLTNVVEVSTGGIDIDSSNNVYTHTTAVASPSRDMHVRKWLSGDAGAPGGRMSYEIVFINQGNATASDVVLTDTLPLSTTYVSWWGETYNPNYTYLGGVITPTVEGGQVVWELDSMVADGHGNLYLTVQVSDTASIGQVLTNVVEVSTSDADVDPGDDVYTYTTTVASPLPDLNLYKGVIDGGAVVGTDMTYAIYYGNSGNAPAHNTVLTETLPSQVTLVSTSGRFTPTVEGNGMVWDLGTAPNYESGYLDVTVHVLDDAVPGTSLSNRVDISTTDIEFRYTNNAYTRTLTIVEPFHKTANILFVPDSKGADTGWYRSYYTGTLNELGTDYDVWDTAHRGAPTGEVLGLYTDGIVIWSMPDWEGYLYNGGVLAEVEAYLDAGGKLFITGQDVGWAAGNTGHLSFLSNYLYALYVQDNSGMHALEGVAGDPIGDGLLLGISGGDGADNQWYPDVVEPIEPALTVLTYDDTALMTGSSPVAPEKALPVRRGESDLLAGVPPKNKIDGAPWLRKETGPLDGPMEVMSSGPAGLRVDTGTYKLVYFSFGFEAINNQNDRTLVMDRVLTWLRGQDLPVLSITKAESDDPVVPGDLLTYTLIVDNVGNAAASGVTITDTVPGETEFAWAEAGGSLVGDEVQWTGLAVGAGKSLTVTFAVTASEALPDGTILTNAAYGVTSAEGVSATGSPVTTTVRVSAPVLSITKSENDDPVAPGDLLTYTLVVDNVGNAAASGVTITDTVPGETEFAWAEDGGSLVGDEVQWTGLAVGAGKSLTVTFAVTVSESLPDGTVLTNGAYGVTSAEGAIAAGRPVTTTVRVSAPVLSITKSESDDPVAPGDLLTYTLVVDNAGSAAASGVTITDAVPGETEFAWSEDGGSLVGDEVQWTGLAVGAGRSLTVTFAVTVSEALPDGTILTNAEYGVTSAEGASAIGSPVTTMVKSVYDVYLPIVFKLYHP